MRRASACGFVGFGACGLLAALAVGGAGCGSAQGGSGFAPGEGDDAAAAAPADAGATTGRPPSDAAAPGTFGDGAVSPPPPADGGGVVVHTTIYANTDDSLYSMDPQTNAVTLLGAFTGMGGGTNDTSVTDCAVNGDGDVFVNTESVVYRAALPAAPGGGVKLTKVASIAVKSGQRFYALAFAPAGVLGAGETLVGGDGNGELWSIDAATGATKDLGSFGPDKAQPGNVLALSGDIMFYDDASHKPTGLATIRSCQKGTTKCDKSSDFLAAIDMTALAGAYASGTPAATLLAGIYGGSATSDGSGTGQGGLFGLGAWEGDVYAFGRASSGTSATPPSLLAIDTKTGKGAVLPTSFTFKNGWSGAGVTTKVTVTVPPPPPSPR